MFERLFCSTHSPAMRWCTAYGACHACKKRTVSIAKLEWGRACMHEQEMGWCTAYGAIRKELSA